MKHNPKRIRLKQYIQKLFDILAETLESCAWFPTPRQMNLPQVDLQRGKN